MTLSERLELLVKLGDHLRAGDEFLEALMKRGSFDNPWFTVKNQQLAVRAIAENMLRPEKLDAWLESYDIPEVRKPKKVGLVMAGNIPLVGFHDWLCVFVAGHHALVKLSEKDKFLFPYFLKLLTRWDARMEDYTSLVEKLEGFDAVIATGSNNSARYFEQYFGRHPHIIRKNRNGAAVLTGDESAADLEALGRDIFQYFGMGCRNVAKVYVPVGYDFEPLLEALHAYKDLILHNKYKNNFDYNIAIKVLNKEEYRNNGCVILSENTSLQSRVSELNYEFYQDPDDLEEKLAQREDEIQCVVAPEGTLKRPTLPFGRAQQPELWDYADGVDTLTFLLNL